MISSVLTMAFIQAHLLYFSRPFIAFLLYQKHDRSVARIDMYQTLDTIKVDTVNKNVYEIVSEILTL